MEIPLEVSRHCIETASRKKYEGLIRQYFKPAISDKKKDTLEKQINALKYFLEKADFPKIRNHFNTIGSDGTKAILIIPQIFEDMHIRINKNTLYPDWKNK